MKLQFTYLFYFANQSSLSAILSISSSLTSLAPYISQSPHHSSSNHLKDAWRNGNASAHKGQRGRPATSPASELVSSSRFPGRTSKQASNRFSDLALRDKRLSGYQEVKAFKLAGRPVMRKIGSLSLSVSIIIFAEGLFLLLQGWRMW